MKKLVCILILFCFVSPAWAYYQVPNWSEFCPYQYVNATPKSHFFGSYSVGILRNNNRAYDYWASRKVDFDNQMQNAYNVPQNHLESYYNQLRASEFNKNNIYYSQTQAEQNKTLQGIERAAVFGMFY